MMNQLVTDAPPQRLGRCAALNAGRCSAGASNAMSWAGWVCNSQACQTCNSRVRWRQPPRARAAPQTAASSWRAGAPRLSCEVAVVVKACGSIPRQQRFAGPGLTG
jgi:ferredoxin